MKTVHFFQPQYVTLYGNQSYIWLPYSAACVWAYANQFDDISDYYRLSKIHYRRKSTNDIIEELDNPGICAFSCYLWNEQYCLKTAELIKKKWPKCVIIFGGSQAGFNYLKHDFIDCIIMSEGELAFVDILRRIKNNQPLEKIYNQKQRLDNLDIPSPYLLGLFNDIISENPGAMFNAVLETNRGCPYSCTFCDWGGLVESKVKRFELDKIQQEIQWMRDNQVGAIFLADANFGIFKERDLEIARMLRSISRGSQIDLVWLNYTKNSNDTVFEIARELGDLSKSVTLSVQSMNPDTLKAVKRTNMESNDIARLIALGEKYNIATYSEMILGLPQETLESWKSGITGLLESGQHNSCDVYFANILENSELNRLQRAQYKLRTISVYDYQPFSLQTEGDVREITDIVTSTSTMTTDDMVNAWMYSWIIQHFHFVGYSQLIARYYRHVHSVSYRDFYDAFLDKLMSTPGALRDEYIKIKQCVLELLTQGKIITAPIEVHFLSYASYYFFYQHMSDIIDIAQKTGESFAPLDSTVLDLQQQYVINSTWPQGQVLCNYNILTWESQPHQYQVSARIPNFVPSYESISMCRRKGLMRNSIVAV
jgi:putative methyltransferase